MKRGASKREKGVELMGDGMAGRGREKGRTSEARKRGKNPRGGKRHDPKHSLRNTLFLSL